MKILILLILISIFCSDLKSQSLELFGPRAGVGNLTSSGNSRIKQGIHSSFGWEIELPYSDNDLTGYGAAGVKLLGIEQQKAYPHIWGYFGCRYKSIGAGLGPVYNAIGAGLGLNIYTNLYSEKLRIPIGIDFNIIGKISRVELFIGFNYK